MGMFHHQEWWVQPFNHWTMDLGDQRVNYTAGVCSRISSKHPSFLWLGLEVPLKIRNRQFWQTTSTSINTLVFSLNTSMPVYISILYMYIYISFNIYNLQIRFKYIFYMCTNHYTQSKPNGTVCYLIGSSTLLTLDICLPASGFRNSNVHLIV